jgi:hypothetical protein
LRCVQLFDLCVEFLVIAVVRILCSRDALFVQRITPDGRTIFKFLLDDMPAKGFTPGVSVKVLSVSDRLIRDTVGVFIWRCLKDESRSSHVRGLYMYTMDSNISQREV